MPQINTNYLLMAIGQFKKIFMVFLNFTDSLNDPHKYSVFLNKVIRICVIS